MVASRGCCTEMPVAEKKVRALDQLHHALSLNQGRPTGKISASVFRELELIPYRGSRGELNNATIKYKIYL